MKKSNNLTIGVTGAAGFIGSNLSEALVSKGYKVIGVDNLQNHSKDNLKQLKDNKNFAFFRQDITNFEKISKAFKEVRIIIHLAAFKIPRYANRLETLLTNTKGTQNILEIARKSRAKVIFSSTSDVYGKSNQLPFSEDGDSIIGPPEVARWSYAVSKIFDEHLLFAYRQKYNIPFVILRFFNVYGPKQSRSWLGGPQSLFIDALLNGREIDIHGTGKQTRSFSYVDDIVDAIIKSMEEASAIGEVINLGTTEEISIIDFAKMISKLTKKPLKIKKVSYKSFTGKSYEDVKKRRPDIKKAKEILRWQPVTPLENGLKKTIAWHMENPI